MVPEFEEFLLPTLKVIADGKLRSVQQIRDNVVAAFDFSEEELKETTRSGNNTKVNDRITWALTYLRQASLAESPKRAFVQITYAGLELLENPPKQITRKFLYSKYPSFRDFNNRKRASQKDEVKDYMESHTIDNIGTELGLEEKLTNLRKAINAFRMCGSEPSPEQLQMVADLEKQIASTRIIIPIAKTIESIGLSKRYVLSIKVDNGKLAFKYSNSEEDILQFPADALNIELPIKEEVKTARKRRPNLNFFEMGLITGDELSYNTDDSIKVTISSETKVEYLGKEYSLTRLTQELKGLNHAIQPTGEWSFDGQNLLDLYNETYPEI